MSVLPKRRYANVTSLAAVTNWLGAVRLEGLSGASWVTGKLLFGRAGSVRQQSRRSAPKAPGRGPGPHPGPRQDDDARLERGTASTHETLAAAAWPGALR